MKSLARGSDALSGVAAAAATPRSTRAGPHEVGEASAVERGAGIRARAPALASRRPRCVSPMPPVARERARRVPKTAHRALWARRGTRDANSRRARRRGFRIHDIVENASPARLDVDGAPRRRDGAAPEVVHRGTRTLVWRLKISDTTRGAPETNANRASAHLAVAQSALISPSANCTVRLFGCPLTLSSRSMTESTSSPDPAMTFEPI